MEKDAKTPNETVNPGPECAKIVHKATVEHEDFNLGFLLGLQPDPELLVKEIQGWGNSKREEINSLQQALDESNARVQSLTLALHLSEEARMRDRLSFNQALKEVQDSLLDTETARISLELELKREQQKLSSTKKKFIEDLAGEIRLLKESRQDLARMAHHLLPGQESKQADPMLPGSGRSDVKPVSLDGVIKPAATFRKGGSSCNNEARNCASALFLKDVGSGLSLELRYKDADGHGPARVTKRAKHD
ncbi:hypothetical protein C8J57DRAFT_1367061 [Mycena rebaudengoi]|nr:hypothetical protein C8J57DRAFT_1367061 [Mycena rebaudengoi]